MRSMASTVIFAGMMVSDMWLKRWTISTIPVAVFSLWLGFVPWLIIFFYYLNLWIIFYSKDNNGNAGRSENSSDLLGGPF